MSPKNHPTNSRSPDDRLVSFLQQHQPIPEPSSPGLEDQILQSIAELETEPSSPRNRRIKWVSAAIVTVSLLVGVGGYQRWSAQMAHQPLSEDEIANLDRFLETTWNEAILASETEESSAEDSWFLFETN
ncbi:hypothetical protein [Roseofilum casamattae]|uniref:DUF3619 family protein n=1 Tax=Roseofilum casamattae BLCC-M143 TaxID=3022442 RepID=A0ABT7BW53_9CYAN|nr:hypothetical protein [Roseofilum casamattae]MDJ1183406.1 hypothetical protein [Roseofilum casamattae BLCC-M143]